MAIGHYLFLWRWILNRCIVWFPTHFRPFLCWQKYFQRNDIIWHNSHVDERKYACCFETAYFKIKKNKTKFQKCYAQRKIYIIIGYGNDKASRIKCIWNEANVDPFTQIRVNKQISKKSFHFLMAWPPLQTYYFKPCHAIFIQLKIL